MPAPIPHMALSQPNSAARPEKRRASSELRKQYEKRRRLAQEAPGNTYMRVTGMRAIPDGTRDFLESINGTVDQDCNNVSKSSSREEAVPEPPHQPTITHDSPVPTPSTRGNSCSVPPLSTDGPVAGALTASIPGPRATYKMKKTGGTQSSRCNAKRPQGTERIILHGRGHGELKAWKEQTEEMAKRMGCYAELLQSSPSQYHYNTVEAQEAKLRVGTAFHIVWNSISPSIAAYMCVLGFNTIGGKDAARVYGEARRAAERIHIVRDAKQGAEEVDLMASVLFRMGGGGDMKFFPSPEHHKEAISWLAKMLRRKADTGDQDAQSFIASWEERQRQRAADAMPSSCPSGLPSPSPQAEIEAQREELSGFLISSVPSLMRDLAQNKAQSATQGSQSSRYPTPIDDADVKPEPLKS